MNGYTYPQKPDTTHARLEALKVIAIESGWSDIAAATDNLLDLLKQKSLQIRTGAENGSISTGIECDVAATGISQKTIW